MPARISAEGRVVAPERQGQPGDLSPAEGSGAGELLRYGSAQGLELLSGSLRFAGFDVMTALQVFAGVGHRCSGRHQRWLSRGSALSSQKTCVTPTDETGSVRRPAGPGPHGYP